MGPLICEAAGQAANACCYRRTKSSARRIGTEFRSWFGAYLCGIASNHTNAVPVFRCWARRLHLALRVESRPFDSALGYILRLGLLIRACTLRLPKGEVWPDVGGLIVQFNESRRSHHQWQGRWKVPLAVSLSTTPATNERTIYRGQRSGVFTMW